jgi:nicotinamidase-related amidase
MMNSSRLSAQDISFIFIDLQEKLLNAIPNSKKIVDRNALLLDVAEVLHVPLIATTQYAKGLGHIVPEIEKRLLVSAMDKTTFSCGLNPAISQTLKDLERPWVVAAGVETHICVCQTVNDLIQSGLRVAVIADAVSARHELDHRVGLERMEQAGALILTTEMLTYELLQRSDTEAFKRLLPSIKKLSS